MPPSPFTNLQLGSLVIAPMITGSISFMASLTIIYMINQSQVKLSTTYRRLIFSISVFDLLQSLSNALSSLPMPSGTMLFAIGNDASCDIQGFFNTVGSVGAILYSLSIAIYFLLIIKFNVDDIQIKKKYEPYLHAFPIFYSISLGIFIMSTNNYNASGQICWIATEPLGCMDDPDVECISKGNIYVLKFLACFPFIGVFFMNCTIMGLLWNVVYAQQERNQVHRLSWIQGPAAATTTTTTTTTNNNDDNALPDLQVLVPAASLKTEEDIEDEAMHTYSPQQQQRHNIGVVSLSKSIRNIFKKQSEEARASALYPKVNGSNSKSNSNSNSNALSAYISRSSKKTMQRRSEVSNRAFAFMLGYIMTYFFAILYRSIEIFSSGNFLIKGMNMSSDLQPYFVIIFLARVFYPMQGFFNVMIYAYPYVTSVRQNHSEYSWFRALWEVLKSGGDRDQIYTGRKSRRISRIERV